MTATPQSLIIKPGNDMPATECPGPGTPFNFSAPARGQSTDCKVTWQRSGTYNATVSIVWSARWIGTGGASGVLPDLTVSTTFPVRVAEGQAVN
ncbi:hypothetical protein [Actinomadura sp. 3N407]|uniref:hypothetical protein n=1 Tax=Actinomadura sp. 3N407 TaxID=3457423 RepID=UPI003FCEDBC5